MRINGDKLTDYGFYYYGKLYATEQEAYEDNDEEFDDYDPEKQETSKK